MRFTNLQVGRIAAASLVLVFHAAFYGQFCLGVPNPLSGTPPAYWFRTTVVFLFALSGFVLAHSLQRGSLRSFVGFRLLRLFPAFWAAVAVVVAVRYATDTLPPVTGKGLRKLLTLWPDGTRQESVLHVEWTLVYELFLSMAIVPLAALGRRRGLGLGVGAWLVLCLGKQFVSPVVEPVWQPRWREMPLSVVNVPFLLGVLVYLAHRHLAAGRSAVALGAALALTAGAAVVGTANTWSYVLQSVGAVLAVGYWAGGRQADDESPLVRAGDWAYGVYLMHVPVLFVFFTLAGRYGWLPASNSAVLFGGVLALCVGAGYGALEWAAYRRIRAKLIRTHRPAAAAPAAPPLRAAA